MRDFPSLDMREGGGVLETLFHHGNMVQCGLRGTSDSNRYLFCHKKNCFQVLEKVHKLIVDLKHWKIINIIVVIKT